MCVIYYNGTHHLTRDDGTMIDAAGVVSVVPKGTRICDRPLGSFFLDEDGVFRTQRYTLTGVIDCYYALGAHKDKVPQSVCEPIVTYRLGDLIAGTVFEHRGEEFTVLTGPNRVSTVNGGYRHEVLDPETIVKVRRML